MSSLGAATALAALPTHLTAAAWSADVQLVKHRYPTSPGDRASFASGSTDAEARGIVGICEDVVDETSLFSRSFSDCFHANNVAMQGVSSTPSGLAGREDAERRWGGVAA